MGACGDCQFCVPAVEQLKDVQEPRWWLIQQGVGDSTQLSLLVTCICVVDHQQSYILGP